jgi:hypothetical protein
MPEKTPNGFVLIELVTTLILVGFIGAFVGLFLFTGIKGFLASKRNSETALKAQFALDRISAELRYIESLPAPPVPDTSITYRSKDLPGNRVLSYNSGTRTINLNVTNVANPLGAMLLLDNVMYYNFDLNFADMDNADGDQEIKLIIIDFIVADVPKAFSLRMHPRTFINWP